MRKGRTRVNGTGLFERNVGGDLLSHTLTSAVPSALEGLASGFGMGPGVPRSAKTTDNTIQLSPIDPDTFEKPRTRKGNRPRVEHQPPTTEPPLSAGYP